MKLFRRFPKKYLLIIPILIILVVSILSVIEVRAQEDLLTELESRLTQLGISVKSITIDNRLPFEFSITLQSSTSGGHRTEEDG